MWSIVYEHEKNENKNTRQIYLLSKDVMLKTRNKTRNVSKDNKKEEIKISSFEFIFSFHSVATSCG